DERAVDGERGIGAGDGEQQRGGGCETGQDERALHGGSVGGRGTTFRWKPIVGACMPARKRDNSRHSGRRAAMRRASSAARVSYIEDWSSRPAVAITTAVR